jgi:hypothetical protein
VAIGRSPATRPAVPPAECLDTELERIGGMNMGQLRAHWRETFASDPPSAFSKDLLARAICHRLQEQTFGGLSASTSRQLRALVNPGCEPPRRLKVGSVLVREHQGLVHEVLVVPGGFSWQGRTHDSLSTIAKTITGTSWSGTRFFGLRSRKISDQEGDPTAGRDFPERDRKPPRRSGRRSSMRAAISGDAGGGS